MTTVTTLSAVPLDEAEVLLASLSNEDLLAIGRIADWHSVRRKMQTEPDGDWWTIWLMKAGRGAGKTRTASEWVFEQAWLSPNSRTLVLAPTYGDLSGICFEGESGLLNVIPRELIIPTKSGCLQRYP